MTKRKIQQDSNDMEIDSLTSSPENKKKKIKSSDKRTTKPTTKKKSLTPQPEIRLENKQIEPTSKSKTLKILLLYQIRLHTLVF